ncbi:MAG: PilT/PilU family type 4a pilus ATPase, partial [Deltaproteobacteria bacterium]|nr:PilT/PilU family type 4a pilus ATPase [Deltaproteobacteria bacterium]
PPMFRVEGMTRPYGEANLTSHQVEEIALSLLSERQKAEFSEKMEMNLALFYPDIGRFRVNVFRQKGFVGIVFRQIKLEIDSLDDLGMPAILKDIGMTKRGLVLVVGGTGTGKSTTLAGIIDHRNSSAPGHIITVEDPIEFLYPHKKCIISQRELGIDTLSYSEALKNTLRQAPDVILIGEIRDRETMESAVAFAETGHLCLSTLHANNANQGIERIMNFFPPEKQEQIYFQLSLNIRAIISQRLIPTVDNKRAAAIEILLDTPRVKDLIMKRKIDVLKEAMTDGTNEGMQTFDQAIYTLFKSGRISYENAIAYADSANDLRLKIKMDNIDETSKQETTQKPVEDSDALRLKS